MEYHKELVRCVVRAFYETEHIVIIDSLVAHFALPVSDLALVLDLSKQAKTVQRICTKLKEAGLVSTHSRQEMREGALKPITREYYFIDYRHAIDATKYRIHMIDMRIKRDAKPTSERKEYSCHTCSAEWTVIEVLDNPDPAGGGSGFLCKRCNHPLTFSNTDEAVQEQDDRPSLFNRQFGHLLTLLQRIDESTVPESTGEQALRDAIPIPRDEHLNPALRTQVMPEAYVKPSAVKGLAPTENHIEVTITSDKDSSAAELAAAAAQRAKIAQQNALPSWYTHSTITGAATGVGALGVPDSNGAAVEAALSAHTAASAATDAARDPNLDAYFAALKAEQERAAQEDESEEEEDDDDEFEDVPTGAANDSLSADAPATKRARTDGAPAAAPVPTPPPPAPAPIISDGDDDDDDDDDEFEDVV